ncbi:MAG: isochorismatase family protein [Desulforegulaceae bacterium]|nr:isochorismatase family protein [Desulforegulaceae bacterium]
MEDFYLTKPVKLEITNELDLHNFKPGEVKELIEEYIYQCIKINIFEVRIIHGKGKGILRKKVESVLKKNTFVKSFSTASPGSGFWGATIAVLKKPDEDKKMNSDKCLIIVDMLNDFIDKKGALFSGKTAQKACEKIKLRLDEFRKNNHPVIFLKDSHDLNDKEFEKFPKHCVKNTWGSKIIDELKPLENEIIIEKTRYSGFYNTRLDQVLRKINPKSIYLCGVCTSICVMDTAGGLANRDYKVIIHENETADFDEEMHVFSIKRMKNIYGVEII